MKIYPKIEYGMKICGFVHPREMVGPISFKSSNSKRVYAEFIISRYWDDDTDPMSYKIVLVPTPKYYKYICKERMYSYDFVTSLYGYGNSFVRAKDVFNSFSNYIKENGVQTNKGYELDIEDKNLRYDGLKVKKIIFPRSNMYGEIKVICKQGIFNKTLLLKNISESTQLMCRCFMNI